MEPLTSRMVFFLALILIIATVAVIMKIIDTRHERWKAEDETFKELQLAKLQAGYPQSTLIDDDTQEEHGHA